MFELQWIRYEDMMVTKWNTRIVYWMESFRLTFEYDYVLLHSRVQECPGWLNNKENNIAEKQMDWKPYALPSTPYMNFWIGVEHSVKRRGTIFKTPRMIWIVL